MNIGYIRVSTILQNLDRQRDKMRSLGVEDRFIYEEKESGKDFERPVYQAMKLTLREGDVLFIDALDRLGRNYELLIEEWKDLTKRLKVEVVALDSEMFDSRKFKLQGDIGKLMEDQMLSIFAYVAEQERNKMLQRQREGIEIARRKGKYKGRPKANIDLALFEQLYTEALNKERTHTWVRKKLGLSMGGYFYIRKEFDTKTGRFAYLKDKSEENKN